MFRLAVRVPAFYGRAKRRHTPPLNKLCQNNGGVKMNYSVSYNEKKNTHAVYHGETKIKTFKGQDEAWAFMRRKNREEAALTQHNSGHGRASGSVQGA
jgi:hypothetical protein